MDKKKKTDSIENIVRAAKKEFGDEIIVLGDLGDALKNEKPEVISTGNRAIDSALGCGGLPRGRIVEIMGMEGGGKSTLVLETIAVAQQQGMQCALIDTEHSVDRQRAERIGVNFGHLAISQPNSAEEALGLLEFLIRTNSFGVIAVDSVAALIPQAEIEGDMTDATIGVQARLMGKILRKIVAPANETKTLILFTNQIRAKMGGFGYMPQETTSGGNALKFYATMRIDIRRIGNIKSGDKVVSTEHKIVVKKNKLAVPMATVTVRIGADGWIDE